VNDTRELQPESKVLQGNGLVAAAQQAKKAKYKQYDRGHLIRLLSPN